jgi:formylglycine-generating enzyme required for sulfatase activity
MPFPALLGIGSLISGISSTAHGVLSRKNAGKSQQLTVPPDRKIVVGGASPEENRAQARNQLQERRALQIEQKAQDLNRARELRQFDREIAISVVQEQKRQNTSPIWLVAEDLLVRDHLGETLPLHIFFSSPILKSDRDRENPNYQGFPNIENYLQDELRKLFRNYAIAKRPNDYLAGAWTNNQFANEAAARQIFIGLKGKPTLMLESTLEGENISINFAYWGLDDVKERYVSVMNFSWQETLCDFVKTRTANWFRNRAAAGTSEAEWIADYGEEVVRKYQVNQAIADREQLCLDRGEDIREIPRKYHLAPKDYDELKRYIAIYYCLIAGWIADEYFLLGVSPNLSQPPLLPDLLPELLAGTSLELQAQICAESSAFYQDLYQRLSTQIPDWEPELRLELATTLAKLPNRAVAIDQINTSLTAWLSARGINWQPSEPVVAILATVAQPEDEEYLLALNLAWQSVGITDRLVIGSDLDRQGDHFLNRGNSGTAIDNHDDRSLNLGDATADDRELVLQFQQHLTERGNHQQTEQVVDLLHKAVEVERQRQEQVEIENSQGQLFDFEILLVNNRGDEIKREQKQARCLTETLPQGSTLDKVSIPSGTFTMGSPAEEGSDDEKPQHQVTIPTFFMSKYPITQSQWRSVAALPQVQRQLQLDPSHFKGDHRPVESISWHDAVEFCARLSRFTGQDYRLPSEAEWEFACRVGTLPLNSAQAATPFHFGETITTKLANYNGNHTYGDAPKGEYRQQTTNVGSFPPNDFGLYDLHGNVWEWCADTWHDNYVGAPTDGSARTNGDRDRAPLRGGSWSSYPYYCRSAYRYYLGRDIIYSFIGFRVVHN